MLEKYLNSLNEYDKIIAQQLLAKSLEFWNNLRDDVKAKNSELIKQELFPDNYITEDLIEGMIRSFLVVPILIKTKILKTKGIIKKTNILTSTGENLFLILGYLQILLRSITQSKKDEDDVYTRYA